MFLAFLATVAILLIAIAAAKLVLPGWLRGKLEEIAGRATGRHLTIGGPLELSLSLTPSVTATDIRFGNFAGGSDPTMLRVGRLSVSVDLRSLRSRPFRVHRIEIEDVSVLLERDVGGRPNWTFDLPPREKPAASRPAGPLVLVDEAIVRRFRLVYRPRGDAPPLDLGVDDLTARLDPVKDEIEVATKGTFNDQPWHLDGTVGPVAKIFEGRDIDQALTGGIGASTLSLSGHLRDPMTLGGPSLHLDVAGPDVAAALAVFGLTSPLTGPFHVDAKVAPSDARVGLDLTARLQDVEAKLTGRVDALLDLERAEATVDARGPDASVIGAWTKVTGLPARPFRVAGDVRWEERHLDLDRVAVSVGGIAARVSGPLGPFPRIIGTDLAVEAHGDDLASLSKLARVELPSGPFDLRGRFLRREDGLALGPTDVHVGGAAVTAEGTIGQPPRVPNLDLTFHGAGPDASVLSSVARVALPAERFEVEGRVARDGVAYRLEKIAGHLGGAAFAGGGTIVPVTGLTGSTGHVQVDGDDLAHTVGLFGGHGVPPQPYSIAAAVSVAPGGYDFEDVVAHVGKMDAAAKGHVSAPRFTTATSVAVSVSGNRLSDLTAWGVSAKLPPDRFHVEGTLTIDDGVYRAPSVRGEVGEDRIEVHGVFGRLPDTSSYDADVKASGPSLAAVARFIPGDRPPRLPDAPFDVGGHVRPADGAIALTNATGTVGAAKLSLDGTLGSKTDVTFHVTAPDTTLPAALLGARLPDGALDARGRVAHDGGGYRFDGVKLVLGPSAATIDGTLGNPPALAGSALSVDVEGPDLAAVLGPPTGLSPLPHDTFAARGRFEGDRRRIASDRFAAKLGASDVEGTLAIGLEDRTTIDADLRSRHLDVAGLIDDFREPAAEGDGAEDSAKKGKKDKTRLVLPEMPLELDFLRRIETHTQLAADEVDFPGVPMRGVAIDARVSDGGLHVERFEGTGANGGRLSLRAALAPADGRYRLDLAGSLDDGRLTVFSGKQTTGKEPSLDVEIEVAGTGGSLHEIAASSQGRALVTLGAGHIPNTAVGKFSSGFFLSLLDVLNPFRKSSPDTPLECGVAAAAIDGGKMVVDPIATRTDKLTVLGKGKLDFGDEAVDLTWTLKPRRGVGINAGTIVNPFIKVGGTLANPKLETKPLDAAVTTGAAVATAGITVLLKGVYDRITAEKNVCAKALAKARAREAAQAAGAEKN